MMFAWEGMRKDEEGLAISIRFSKKSHVSANIIKESDFVNKIFFRSLDGLGHLKII